MSSGGRPGNLFTRAIVLVPETLIVECIMQDSSSCPVRHIVLAGASLVLMTLGGCNDSSSDEEVGRMTLSITDSPVTDAEQVWIEFTGVEVKARAEGAPEVFDFDTPRQINLLALDGGGSEILLDNVLLPAGEYEWIRLKVNAGLDGSDSYVVTTSGGEVPIFIPSGNETGLKLVSGFTVGVGSIVDYTIDFDLRQSLTWASGLGDVYTLKPALRLVDNLEVGVIAGTVGEPHRTRIADGTCIPAVYLYTGSVDTPDDYGSATAPPLASTAVNLNDATGDYVYRLAFVPAGSYTVALTCDADADLGATDEAPDVVAFIDPQAVTVAAGVTETVNFPAG